MPRIDKRVIEQLIAARNKDCDATCFYDSEGNDPEPMVCIWEPRCATLLKDFYSTGNISPRKFLKSHRVHLVKPPFPGMHLNINTPDEMEAFRRTHLSD
jgi:molybdopterin-guanine dinucleotide biosynthesis protein A